MNILGLSGLLITPISKESTSHKKDNPGLPTKTKCYSSSTESSFKEKKATLLFYLHKITGEPFLSNINGSGI
jgi:hypothetical protein